MRSRPMHLLAAILVLTAVPARAVVWEWSTNGNFEGWAGWNHVTNTSVSGGSMNGTITGGDPFVYSPGSLALSGSSNTWFKVYITYSPGAGTATPFQVFYNRGAGINEPDSFHFTVHPGTELYQVHVPRRIAEQGKTNNWTGNTISQIRFDLGSHSSGTFNIHWVAIENFPIPDWDFNITPAGGAPHPSGWYVENQITNWQVTNDRKLEFNVTGGDPYFTVNPLAFDPATHRYVYMRQEVAGYSVDNPNTAETHSFPGTGSSFVYKSWRYYPNIGYETVVLDMHTRTTNSSWNGVSGSISTVRIDPATGNTSGTHRYDRVGIYTAASIDSGTRIWNGMSGPGAWIAPKHGSYAGSTANIAGGVATLTRTGSNPFGIMNVDFAVNAANRYLYIDVEPVTTAPRNNVAMTVQWRADGLDFASQNTRRRYTNLRGGQGMKRYVLDLGAVQASPYDGAWSGFPHGLLLHFDHAADLSTVRIANVGLVSTVHTVTASAGANGAIWPSGNVLVTNGTNAVFDIQPNPGYRVSEILVDGVRVSPVLNANLQYTISNVTSNRSISVTFAPADWPFDTAGYTDGWSVMNQIQPGWTVSGGILAYDITETATDPMWASQWMNLPASQFDWLMVRARNGTRSSGAILFWDDNTVGNFTGGYQANYPINPNDPEYSTYWVNLRALPLWQAATTIQRLRFDFPDSPLPPSGLGTRVEVDRILLSASGPPAPTVLSIVRLDPTPTNAGSVRFEVRFSHTMSALTTSDFTLAGTGTATGSIAPLEILGPTRARVTVNALAGSGTLGLNFVPNQTARDVANQLVASGFTGQVYTVDTEAPTAVCQDITAFLNASGAVTVLPGDIDGGSTDYFGITGRTINGGASVTFNCADLGDHTVTLGLVDALGNTSSCQATVTVADNISPVAVCQNIVVGLSSPTISADALDGGSTDNCGVTTWLMDGQPGRTFTCADVGANAIELRVGDASGNTSTCMAMVTVVDDISPAAVCQNITVNLSSPAITANALDGGSTDNCGVTVWLMDGQPGRTFTCADVGANAVALRVEDAAGNSSTCTATVTVVDDISPAAVCQDVTVNLSSPTLAAAAIDGGSSDNCGITTRLIDGQPARTFTCADLGANTVTLRVEDAAGNFATCTATVTVVDNVAPVVACLPVTVNLSSPTLSPADIFDAAGSSDNCGGAVTPTLVNGAADITFTCAELGDNTVILTAEDNAGNTGTCTATVTVVDDIEPVVACQDVTVNLSSPTLNPVTIFDAAGSSDNCGGTVTPTLIDGAADKTFTCADIALSPITVTLTAEDDAGNTATCTAAVTVVDNVAPVVACLPVTVNLSSPTLSPADIFDAAGSSDNCGGTVTPTLVNGAADITFTCAELGDNTVTLTAEDDAGNTGTCTATVTVVDDIAPVVTINGGNALSSACDAGPVTLPGATAADNCDGALAAAISDLGGLDPGNPAVGTYNVEYSATDNAGNTGTEVLVVSITDNVPPVAIARNVTRNLSVGGQVTAADVNNGSSDNCGPMTITLQGGPIDVTCANVGFHAVTLVVEDAAGNLVTDTATVTIQDNVPPVAACQDVSINLSSPVVFGIDLDGGSSDTCGITVWLVDGQPSKSFTCANLGPNTVELRVEDAAGNFDTCTATVTVVDDIAPVAACADITVNLSSPTITGDDLDGSSTDNCGIAARFVDGANARTFTCADLGANTVELRVEDAAGNFDTCTATVTVVDDTPPVAVCQDVAAYLSAGGQVTAADVDDGSSDDCSPVTLSLEDGPLDVTCANVGAHTVTLLVEDAAGNVGRCTATVTIVDDVPPVAVCQDATVQLDETGTGVLLVSDLDAGSSDNCSVASVTLDRDVFTCIDTLAPVTVMLIVRDEAGNQSTCTASVTVVDPLDTCALVVTQLGDISVTKMENYAHTFGVSVEGGVGAIDIQWQYAAATGPDAGVFFNLVDTERVLGTLTAALTIDPLVLHVDSGWYRVEVSDQSGSVVHSGVFTLLVIPEVPAAGAAGLVLLALIAAAGGAAAIRRRR